jgi:hypothetical protein
LFIVPITTIHCGRCATEFVDARNQICEGDEAACPHCGARHEFRREFIESSRLADEAENDGGAHVVASRPGAPPQRR